MPSQRAGNRSITQKATDAPVALDQSDDQPSYLEVTAASFSGPFPPPAILAQYDEVVPGAAERIIAMGERQAEHRQNLENQVVTSELRQAQLGVYSALTIASLTLAASAYMAHLGYPNAATIVASVDIVGLAGVFIYGTTVRRNERDTRARLMTGKTKAPPNSQEN